MKKVDLHIHTLSTSSDAHFEFDMDVLESYVRERNIDAIAITNHNIFDLEQFRNISSKLSFITVFPGIEINIGENCGHILVIASRENAEDFKFRCERVKNKVATSQEHLSIEDFKSIYDDLQNYLIIPHYIKNPPVAKNILGDIVNFIESGEVNSVKKFIYCQKDESSLTPVYFSDFRAKASNNELPIRQTFLDVDEIAINSIKFCLQDKQKVSLTEAEGHNMFYALPDLKISTGLNIIIGGRSSGKTYTLDQINEAHETIKYIKQFQLLEKDPRKAEEKFTEELDIQQNKISKDYFSEFSDVIDEIIGISLTEDNRKVEKYISSLLKNAFENERSDLFSKCSLYSEDEFSINDFNDLKELIKAVEKLLGSTHYKDIIEKYIERENLIELHKGLIEKHIYEHELVLHKIWTNDVISAIKSDLEASTAATPISNVDLYEIYMNKIKIEKFLQIVEYLRIPREIFKEDIQGFKIVGTTKLFEGAQGLKNTSKRNVAFSEAFKEYNNPYKYLQELINMDIDETSYYKYFMNVEFKILNRYGLAVSGGDRAEFNLLKEIKDALQYDMLLIDEPESSFDNLFLKDRVNKLIKSISKQIPVIIATHNSTIGASIQPDYVIYTERKIIDTEPIFKRFYGSPSNKYLVSNTGEKIPNIDITLDCLEAGESAYEERRENYEMLRSE